MRRSLLVLFAWWMMVGLEYAQEVNNAPAERAIHSHIHPKKVKQATFPPFEDLGEDLRRLLGRSNNISRFEGKTDQELYDSLDSVRRAGLLNIVKKAESTPLSDGRSVLAHVEELTELRGDRFFAIVPKELQEEAEKGVSDKRFRRANQLLHRPPRGYRRVGSFKTRDRRGNLELSFFRKGEDCIVDLDVDEAVGLPHLLHVLREMLTGRPTHPFVIRQILVIHQNLNPGYSLEF